MHWQAGDGMSCSTRTAARGCIVDHIAGVDAEALLESIAAPGDILKKSKKAVTRKVGEWVVKESPQGLAACALYLGGRKKYRQAWEASNYLMDHGVRVPAPVAYVEKRSWGIPVGGAYVSRFLEGQVNVEEHARKLVAQEVQPADVGHFLIGLADALNVLFASGAWHFDLSGKNIFTADGETFTFIDLDAVVLGVAVTDSLRLKAHVQLYDSFCDYWDDTVLEPFIAALWGERAMPSSWFEEVRQGQVQRRQRIEAIWRKEGRPGCKT